MRRTLVPYLALAAVLLGGCSGKPAPKEPDSTQGTSPETTATPPPLPEAATQETAEGAASFVDYYLDVLNYAKFSGDHETLSGVSANSCEGCQRLVETVERTYTQGGSFEGGEWSANDLSIVELTTVWSATGTVSTTPGYQVPESDGERRESVGTTTNVEFQIAFEGQRWLMMSLSEATV